MPSVDSQTADSQTATPWVTTVFNGPRPLISLVPAIYVVHISFHNMPDHDPTLGTSICRHTLQAAQAGCTETTWHPADACVACGCTTSASPCAGVAAQGASSRVQPGHVWAFAKAVL